MQKGKQILTTGPGHKPLSQKSFSELCLKWRISGLKLNDNLWKISLDPKWKIQIAFFDSKQTHL